jgi:hypothetical protein
MRDLYADTATQRRQSDEPASVGDTLADLISGIVVMLAIIAFGFNMIGFFS